MTRQPFRSGDEVIWLKNTGGFVWPVAATVVAVTAKRVTIRADDPDETGEGLVTCHVRPDSLQLRVKPTAQGKLRRGGSRGKARTTVFPENDAFAARYPHIASWVQDGWIEIGHDDCGRPFLRAMEIGGVAWEGDEHYPSMDAALRALDDGIAAWLAENQ